jgi:NodT family efflux transporter outer membrane factor (OMF) lipoprotein
MSFIIAMVNLLWMPSRLRQALTLMLCLGTGACTTVGPEFVPPKVDWAEGWQSDYLNAVSHPAADSAEEKYWWRTFEDPVLNQLINEARLHNINLRISGLRVLEARAQLGIAVSYKYPQIQQVTGGATYIDSRTFGGDGPDQDLNFWEYQAGFGLSWELDFWGRFQRSIESADAAFFASVANQEDFQVLLNAQVAELYFTILTLQGRVKIARDNAKFQKRSLEITERLFKSGNDTELDYQQAKTQYMATLASIPQIELSLLKTRNALSYLLGRPPGQLPEIDLTRTELPAISKVLIWDIPASLLQRRPDVRAVSMQAAAQSAMIGIAESELYPSISLLGSIGWSTTTLSGSPNTLGLGVGPSLRWNVFDYGRIRNDVRVQDARLQQLLEKYQDTVLQAAREIDDAAISISKTQEQDQPLAESVKAAKRSFDIANIHYREGLSDFQRVLDAQRALLSQEERYLGNRNSMINNVISLYKGLGGGWQVPEVHELIDEKTRELMKERTDWGGLLDAPLPQFPVDTETVH